jgi:hypothetical protein
MNFAWLGAEEELSAAALTLRAQTIPLDDDGTLLYPNFFPIQNVDSLSFEYVGDVNFRPAADRREFGARGRLIPIRTGTGAKVKWVPIESYFTLGEEEINEQLRSVRGNIDLFRQIVRSMLPDRTDDLARSNTRRVEVDAFNIWLNSQITQRNPQTGSTQTIPIAFDATRYTVAGAAWTGGAGGTAYPNLIAWLQVVIQRMGAIRGIGCRMTTFQRIQSSAPLPLTGLVMTRSDLEARISQEIGMAFRFYIIENTVDVFPDAGTDTTTQAIWTAGKIAAIPLRGTIGNTLVAPVNRAYDLVASLPKAGIDLRGQNVYYEAQNTGRELLVECQWNAFPFPDERNLMVHDTLIP